MISCPELLLRLNKLMMKIISMKLFYDRTKFWIEN